MKRSKPQCNHEWDRLSPNSTGWLCSLPKGHKGVHVAHDLDGSICAQSDWPSIGEPYVDRYLRDAQKGESGS